MGERLCRLGFHKWRRRMVEPHPQFVEDGLSLGLPVRVQWVDYCARDCAAAGLSDAGGRVEP